MAKQISPASLTVIVFKQLPLPSTSKAEAAAWQVLLTHYYQANQDLLRSSAFPLHLTNSLFGTMVL